MNLAVGAYRDDGGVPFVLPSVSEAERRILERGEKKEYAPIDGLADYTKLALQFAYGDCAALKEGRIAGVQTLSGTGACRIAGEFYARFLPKGTAIYASDPTWGNHIPIMQLAGLEVKRYKYLDRATNTLDFDGFMSDFERGAIGLHLPAPRVRAQPDGRRPDAGPAACGHLVDLIHWSEKGAPQKILEMDTCLPGLRERRRREGRLRDSVVRGRGPLAAAGAVLREELWVIWRARRHAVGAMQR